MTTLRPELLDELLTDYEEPEDLLGDEGLFKELKKALLERVLGAELSDHLGYEKGDPAGRGTGNSRNGHTDKTVLTEDGEVDLAVPRDRNGSFEPAIVPKGERRLDGFDDRVQRPVLPFPHLIEHRVGDPADQVRRYRNPVKLLQVTSNLAHRHAARVQRHDAAGTDPEVLDLGHKIVKGSSGRHQRRRTRSSIRFALDPPRHRYGVGM